MISVITVCYNARDCIEKTLLSVINQTYKDVEYIVVDGGSTDGTLQIIEKYRDSINTLVSEKDNGIYDAMNKAIGLAHGEWLNFMNAGDTFSDDNVLEDITKSGLMQKGSFVYSDFYADNGKVKRLIRQSYNEGKILHQSSLYKKELHNNYGLYYQTHPYIVSDYLFFLQVPSKEFVKFDKPISINDTSGLSMQGHWMEYGRISVDYMMHRTGEVYFVMSVLKQYIKNIVKSILRR